MACHGVFVAISSDEASALCAIANESERVEYFLNSIEEEYFTNQPQRVAATDKAWDAIHRLLTDGELSWDGGEYPLNHVVLGGTLLTTEPDFYIVLKTPEQVRDVAALLPGVTRTELRERYLALDEDWEYTWENFEAVREFWLNAASEDRYIVFSFDQ